MEIPRACAMLTDKGETIIMRSMSWLLVAGSLLASGAALAGQDKPVIGAAIPAWVKPVALPPVPTKSDDTPVQILLADQQTQMVAGRVSSYVDLAMRIQTPQGLTAGNLSFPWDPETDTFTVHKLVIHRGDQLIDVLASGQTFTVVRREPNLESATLDGVLTANIQPEGLQVGDILEYAITISSSDPVLKGHVEQWGASWNGTPFTKAHMSVQWPSTLPVNIRQAGSLPPVKPVKMGEMMQVELSLDDVQPEIPPRSAPNRFALGRVIEFSDFKSWAEVGALMAPLYKTAAVVAPQSALRTELEKIKAATSDPVKRAEAALALVQDRVRYVALLMGSGGYVPAKAEETWARRYGDCKAKTTLLLALLQELGIEAEPVAANIGFGDGIDSRLPMVGLFNHVLVRAHIGGKSYWMDGTRTGDQSLARLQTPDFRWGLPLIAKNAALVRMLPDVLDKPDYDLTIDIDARGGITRPAPFKAKAIMRGDSALGTRFSLARMTPQARETSLREYWREQFTFIDIAKVDAIYDAESGEERMTVEGVANMEWRDGWWYETDKTSVGFKADFLRSEGQDKDAPFAVDFPFFSHTVETIQLPPGFPQSKDIASAAVDETVAGIEYRRKAQLQNDIYRIERSARSVLPEFPAKDAPAAQKRLRELADKDVYLRKPDNYRMTSAELDEDLKTAKPSTAEDYARRGVQLLQLGREDEGQAALEKALTIDSKHMPSKATLALLYMKRGEVARAGKLLESMPIAEIDNPATAAMRSGFAADKGDFKTALLAADRAIALAPADPSRLELRGNVYRSMGNDGAALADYDAAIKLKPGRTDARLGRANIFRRQGKMEEALAEARALASEAPKDSYAQVAVARILGAYGKTDEALKIFDRALAIKPEAYIYVNRAETRPKDDKAAKLADYEAALKLEPRMVEAISGKADLQMESGDNAGAIKTYSTAIDVEPDDIGLRSGRGIAYAKMGEKVKADADFAVARSKANGAGVLNNLCWVKATSNVALEAALSECDEALKKEPDSPQILDSRAFVLLRMGRVDDAIKSYDAALAGRAQFPASLYGRAIAWSRKGDKDKAQADRDAALKLDPNVQKQFEGYGVTM